MTETTPNGRKRLTPTRVVNRIKWVKALLSGDYIQGDGQLRDDGYDDDGEPYTAWCCLGVAGHCVKPDAPFVAKDSSDGYLPEKFGFEHFGMTGGADSLGDQDDQDVAVSWNDRECFNFAQIADRVALATEKSQHFEAVTNAPELKDKEPGEYARAWMEGRLENDEFTH